MNVTFMLLRFTGRGLKPYLKMAEYVENISYIYLWNIGSVTMISLQRPASCFSLDLKNLASFQSSMEC